MSRRGKIDSFRILVNKVKYLREKMELYEPNKSQIQGIYSAATPFKYQ